MLFRLCLLFVLVRVLVLVLVAVVTVAVDAYPFLVVFLMLFLMLTFACCLSLSGGRLEHRAPARRYGGPTAAQLRLSG